MEEGFWSNTKQQEACLICLSAGSATSFNTTSVINRFSVGTSWANLSTPVITCQSYTDLRFLSWAQIGLFLGFCLQRNPKLPPQRCNAKPTKVSIRRKLLRQPLQSNTRVLQSSVGNVLFCFSVLSQPSVQRDCFDTGIVFCECWLGTTSPTYTSF